MKYLTKIPDDTAAFDHFGECGYSKEFWDKVKASTIESAKHYEEEEKKLTPTLEYMHNRTFDI